MERVLSWLNQPLFPDTVIRVWMAVAAGAALLLALILAFFLIRRKKKKKRGDQAVEEPITERPEPLPELELANLQGVGSREEQQDAFGISRMDRYEEDGLLAVLCDGMGGMAEGGMIAAETASQLVGIFPWADDSDVPGWVYQRSARVYQQFRGHGGTTLVAALLKENRLSFWCVGDSDLFLLRENKLYGLNARQEFKNDLILREDTGRGVPRGGSVSRSPGRGPFGVHRQRRCNMRLYPYALSSPAGGRAAALLGRGERYPDLKADPRSHGASPPGVLRQAGGRNPGGRQAEPGQLYGHYFEISR